MSSTNYAITKHVFPGQHIRSYPGATRHSEQDIQYLEAKQYTPRSNPNPQDGDITIIGTCATSFPKEMYEPLWDELLTHSSYHGLRIRAIWCVDKSDHGASGVLNEHTQGDEPHYFDLARDLLLMVNTFRDSMVQPLVGIGHSMGATALLELSRLHPRLFSSLVLTDPIIGPETKIAGAVLVNASTQRPDLWDSRAQAEKAFRSAKALKAWDPRVMESWLEFGLRDTPTLLYPEAGKVTLRMSKAQEAWNYARSRFDDVPREGDDRAFERSRAKYADVQAWMIDTRPFYRPEMMDVWIDLPRVRCSVLYVFPARGPLTTATSMAEKVARTGSGPGGSGGEKHGRTEKVIVEGAGHLAPLEKPGECARVTVEWLVKDVQAWQERRRLEREIRDDKSVDQLALSEEWMRRATEWFKDTMAQMKGKPKL